MRTHPCADNVAIRNGVTATSKFIVKGPIVGKGGVSKASAKAWHGQVLLSAPSPSGPVACGGF
jgi:hypothetical protein